MENLEKEKGKEVKEVKEKAIKAAVVVEQPKQDATVVVEAESRRLYFADNGKTPYKTEDNLYHQIDDRKIEYKDGKKFYNGKEVFDVENYELVDNSKFNFSFLKTTTSGKYHSGGCKTC